MSEIVIREGLLCPICMQDLGTIAQLQSHFELLHFDDRDMIDQLKGLFGKAKRKLWKKARDADESVGSLINEVAPSSSESSTDRTVADASGIDPTLWEPQELGVTRNLIGAFKTTRDRRIDHYVVETNKLLIRLDKLTSSDAPTEPSKRKAYERNIVAWAPDADVTICATCGRRFTLTRRRHHCRLCGAILCNKCSQFMPFDYASSDGEQRFRTCLYCRHLLETRERQITARNAKPVISQLYEKMRAEMREVDHLIPSLNDMTESLCAGETTYHLEDAEMTKQKIIKLCELIEKLSKQIASLDADEASTSNQQLQRMMRLSANSFIQQSLLHTQGLPTADQLAKLHEERQRKQEELQRQQQEEQERRLREEQQQQQQQRSMAARKPAVMQLGGGSGGGWLPAEAAAVGGQDDNPMVQQMNIIRSYVKQAKQAQKWDEVQMLEENLKQLQLEYWK